MTADFLSSAGPLAGRYKIEREIGRGGMATVYRARDRRHDRDVAVKVLAPELSAAVGVERFLREIRTVAGLSHPHILPLHDSGETDGRPWFVMPYVEGESLRHRLDAHGALPIDEVIRIGAEIADALSHAHAHGVVHRDIKPENVLLVAGHAVVTDFGIARAVDRSRDATMTGTGLLMGTPAYMSPEQATGDEMDGRSDVYSLGCVLYEALTGAAPFAAATAAASIARRIVEAPPSPRTVRPGVPSALDQVVARCLAVDPANRFASAEELKSALAESVEGGSGWRAAAPQRARRNTTAWLFGGIAAAALVALVLLAGGDRRTAPGTGEDRIAIAVLPFASAGGDEQSRILGAGLHDDLLTKLSKIPSLRVTSRTSVMEYRETTKNTPEIARELGVTYILEGSVLGAGGQINLNAQLIDAAADDHLWAETYNRAITATNLFAIQKELAQRIAESLSTTLLPAEAGSQAPPTENTEAYTFFLRGHAYFQEGPTSDESDLAILMYERAVGLDPAFAEGHARLSLALAMRYESDVFSDAGLMVRAREAADRALALDPDLPEAQLALAQVYYTGERDLDRSLELLTAASQGGLRSAELFHLLGAVQRRKGDVEGSIASFEELVRLDPLTAHFYEDLGTTYWMAARWADAERSLRRVIELAPGSSWSVYDWLAKNATMQGRLDRAQAFADSATLLGIELGWWHSELALLTRDFERAATAYPDSANWRWPMALHMAGRRAEAVAALETTRVWYEGIVAEDPTQPLGRARLGWIYAALGLREEALASAQRAVDMLPISSDYFEGPDMVWWQVLTLAELGDTDAALDALEFLIANKPSGAYARPYLERHPALDPLRSNPRFATLLEPATSPAEPPASTGS